MPSPLSTGGLAVPLATRFELGGIRIDLEVVLRLGGGSWSTASHANAADAGWSAADLDTTAVPSLACT